MRDHTPRSYLDSTLNTRDLGGYRIRGTEFRTVCGRILRSDRCDALSARDKKLLLRKEITTVIDLRSDREAAARPSAFAPDPDFVSLHCPIEEGMMPPGSLAEVPASYMKIAHAGHISQVFRTIAGVPGGVLFHCTAGKDRTGVVSAILLSLCGVSDEDIVSDYVISRECSRQRLDAFLKEHPEIDREVVLTNEASMYGFLALLREKYHATEQYLKEIGIDEREIRLLLDKLTVPDAIDP